MFQRAPKSPETSLPSHSGELTYGEQQRVARRARRLARISLGLLPIVGLSAHYWGDVAVNQERERSAAITLESHDITDFENDGALTTFVDGYGSMNALYLADKFGRAAQQVTEGEIRSANFSDAPIDTGRLANEVINAVEASDQNNASFFGYSAGGLLTLEAAEKIINNENTSTQVETIFLAATPSGPESLREGQVERIEILDAVASAPGARSSSWVHIGVSMVSDFDQYNTGNPQDFFDVLGSNIEQVQTRAEPGVRQLTDQTLAIMNADVDGVLERIGALRGKKQMPVLVYLAADDPTADTVVDNDAAWQRICEAADKAGITCLVYRVPGAVHSVYGTDGASFETVLANAKQEIDGFVSYEQHYYELSVGRNSAAISFRPL